MSKEEIKFEGFDNAKNITIVQWIPIDGKWHHISTTLEWLPNGRLNYKLYLNGVESNNVVKHIKPKQRR